MPWLSQAKFHEIREFFAHFIAINQANERLGYIFWTAIKKAVQYADVRIVRCVTPQRSDLAGEVSLLEAHESV